MKIILKSKYVAIAALSVVGIGTTTVFQNCSKANFTQNQDSLSSSASGGLTTYAQTILNTPVAFALKHDDQLQNVTLQFKVTESHGTFRVIDASAAQIQFTPDVGFRGRQEATVTIVDRYGSTVDLGAVVDVGNGLSAIEPALAVRAANCLACHSQISSNVITDFGYQGDGKGRDYFFGPSGIDNAYGLHSPINDTDMVANRSIYVPAADLPAKVIATIPDDKKSTVKTLADYVKWQFSLSPFAGTKQVKVEEANSIYIGAPTAQLLERVTRLASARFKFYKNEQGSPNLTGLIDKGTYFRNGGTLVCDGDLAIRGPLLLDNLVIDTKNGCRLYVMGSVFIEGSITYANNNSNRNIQITASRLISMGLGQTRVNGHDCEAVGTHYALGTDGTAPIAGFNSFKARFNNYVTGYAFVSRDDADTGKIARDAIADYDLVGAGEGSPILDGACRPDGRDVAFNRIFLNAPNVQSRYRGNVDGTIIAETSLMALGNFKFTFDEVFNNVPVLPFLDKAVYLDVR